MANLDHKSSINTQPTINNRHMFLKTEWKHLFLYIISLNNHGFLSSTGTGKYDIDGGLTSTASFVDRTSSTLFTSQYES